MDDKEYKTRQQQKNTGKYSTKRKDPYNTKRAREYEAQIEKNKSK